MDKTIHGLIEEMATSDHFSKDDLIQIILEGCQDDDYESAIVNVYNVIEDTHLVGVDGTNILVDMVKE